MTDTLTTTAASTDEDAAAFAERMFVAGLQAMEVATVQLGHELGYYEALRATGSASAGELAASTGADERYTREWLEQQTVAGILNVNLPDAAPGDRRYALPDGHAAVLLEEEHEAFMRPFVEFGVVLPRALPRLVDAFRHGKPVQWEDFHAHGAQARQNRPMFANELVASWLAAVPGLTDRLAQRGARVADFGCGWGWSAIYLAEAFPGLQVDGYDVDEDSITAACAIAAERGLSERVRFELQDVGAEGWDPGRYDLVLTVETVHDLTDPVACLRAMRRLTQPGGTALVVDEKVADAFAGEGDELERTFYAFSVLCCLSVGRDGAATGTVMRPSTLREFARQAGWTDVHVLPVEHGFFRFYQPIG